MGEKRRRVLLTQRRIVALRPRQKRYTVADLEIPGLELRVDPSGTKTFALRYGTRERRRFVPIGRYGHLTLDQARARAQEVMGAVKLGRDPAEERERQRQIPTLMEHCRGHIDAKAKRGRRTRDDVYYLLPRPADMGDGRRSDQESPGDLTAAAIGWKRLNEITSEDVSKIHVQLGQRGPVMADRWLAALSSALGAAVRMVQGVPGNVARNVQLFRLEEQSDRILSEDEADRLWRSIMAEPDPNLRAAFAVLATTGRRPVEARRARLDDFDLEALSWRIPRSKKKRNELVPLQPEVAELIPQRGVDESPFLVPGAMPFKPRAELGKAWAVLRDRAALPRDVTMYALRRTVASRVAETAGAFTAAKLLGNDERTAMKHYARADLGRLRKAAGRVAPFKKHRPKEAG